MTEFEGTSERVLPFEVLTSPSFLETRTFQTLWAVYRSKIEKAEMIALQNGDGSSIVKVFMSLTSLRTIVSIHFLFSLYLLLLPWSG